MMAIENSLSRSALPMSIDLAGIQRRESIEGQLSFFDEADATYDNFRNLLLKRSCCFKHVQRKKDSGISTWKISEEILPPYSVSEEQLDAFYGKGNWRRMRMKPTRGFVMSPKHGLANSLLSRCMWELMVIIRMSSFVETDPRTWLRNEHSDAIITGINT